MSEFLFKFVGDLPQPVFDTDLEGRGRKADGKTVFTLRQAARKSGRAAKELRELAVACMGEMMPTLPAGEMMDGGRDAETERRRDEVGTGHQAPSTNHQLLGKFAPDELTLASFRRQFCHGFDDEHVRDALALCRSRDLNPFRCEVYFRLLMTEPKRLQVVAISAINGLRKLASRNPRYGTQQPAQYCSEAGDDWTEVWNISRKGLPFACRKSVSKLGCESATAVAFWHEFAPGLPDEETGEVEVISELWSEKPLLAIAKCAEAMALRQAFPGEIAGIYVEEEITRSLRETARRRKEQREDGFADDAPQTLMQLKLAMINRLDISQADADYRITQMKQERQDLLRRDEAEFCAWAFRKVQRKQSRELVPA